MTNNWQKVRLNDVCIQITDGVHNTVIDTPNTQYYLLSCKNLKNGTIVIRENERTISEETLLTLRKRTQTAKGDVLLSSVGTIGETAIIKDENPNYEFQRSVAIFKPNPDCITSKFLFYVLNNNKKILQHAAHGAVQQCLFINPLKDFEIQLPPLDVQRKIAGVLSVLDDKIELNKKINQNLELQAQSLFNKIYNSSENGVLSDIVDIVESGNRPKGGACTSGIPSIGAENIEKFGVYDFSKEKFVSEEFFDNMKRGKVQSGDVLLYKDGAYTGKVSMALDGFPHKKCVLNEHVFLLRANNKCSQFFLYYCLSYDKNKTYLHNLACAKAAQPGLNQQELLGMPIFIPEYDKIEKFTDIVNPLMHKIAQNALENIKLSAIRDALLPKLMSGEIDVENLPPSAIIPNE